MTDCDSRDPWDVLPEIIETERLRLRPWAVKDIEDVLAYADDEQWSRYLRLVPYPYTRRDAEQFVARQILLDRATHPSWAITSEGAAIGGINVQLQRDHRLGEIGYSLSREHWNRGFCSEATRAVIDAAFTTLASLNRICARADVENGASQRVMEKVGMVKEGVLRQSRVERDEVIDEAWWAILREDWTVSF